MRFASENRVHHLKELLFSGASFVVANPFRLSGALAVLLLVTFLVGAWYGQRGTTLPGGKGERKILYYVDPMNPAHTSPEPGLAPCGMKMEPVFADEVGQTPDTPLLPGAVKVTPQKQQLIGVKVAQVEKAPFTHHLRVLGKVAADETLIYRLNAAVDGWIIKTFDNATGSVVKKDEVLATYYSQDFLAAQQAYISALNQMDRYQATGPGTHDQFPLIRLNVHRSFDTLEILGMSLLQIQEITRTRQYSENIFMVAPATSFVIARNVSPGQRFQKGTEWYRLADLNRVWIMADLYEHESQYVRSGDKVVVRYPYQEKIFSATVSDVPPQFDPATRTLRVRLVADNPGYHLRPDMFVDVDLPVRLPPAITVPADAILDSGLKKTVFVDRGQGYFEPRKVETGWRLGDRVEITQGLAPGEKIVVSGNFLIDSESRMKLAAAGMLGEVNQDPVCGRNLDETKARAAGHFKEIDGKTYYFCSPKCQQQFEMVPERYTSREDQASEAQTAKHEPESSGKKAEPQKPEKPSCCNASPKAKDPVCGMEVEIAKAKETGQKSDFQDKTYYFCGDFCKEKFDKDPERYLGRVATASEEAPGPHSLGAAANASLAKTGRDSSKVLKEGAPPADQGPAAAAYPPGTAKDPVCGRTVDVAQSHEAGWKSEHKGKTYYFHGDLCKKYFDRKPDFYTSGPDIGQTQGLPHPYHHLLGKPEFDSSGPVVGAGAIPPKGWQTAKDPVCGTGVGERFSRALSLTSEFQGKTYFFCSSTCKQAFDQNPEQQLNKVAQAPDQEATPGSHQAHVMPGGQMASPAPTPSPETISKPEVNPGMSPGEEAPQPHQPQAMPEHQGHGAQKPGSAPAPPPAGRSQGGMKDPVCGMQVDPTKAREAGFSSSNQDKVYYFCSEQCKLQFDKSPEKYLKGADGGTPHAQHKPPDESGGGHQHD